MAASEELAAAGEDRYQSSHMQKIFEEGRSFSGYERDLFALNDGTGRFIDHSGVSGIDSISDGRGAVFADFDDDGDTDVFLTTLQNDAHLLFRNDLANGSRSLTLHLEGTPPGLDAFGAIVTVDTGERRLTRVKSGGSGFLSQHDPRLSFGLHSEESVESIEVLWPGGERQVIDDPPRAAVLRVVQGEPRPKGIDVEPFQLSGPATRAERLALRLGWPEGASLANLEVRDASGEKKTLGALARPGRTLLVNLWATWCVTCRDESAELTRLEESLSRRGVDLLGLSVDVETAGGVFDFADRTGIGYPIVVAEESALDWMFPEGELFVPITLLLDDRASLIEVIGSWNRATRARIEELATR